MWAAAGGDFGCRVFGGVEGVFDDEFDRERVTMGEVKHHKRRGKLPEIEVVDLFCGIGGLSYGMKTAGFNILAGYDLDWTCQYAYETNTGGKFFYKDVKEVEGDEIQALYSNKKNTIRVLAGCAPCQPFLPMHTQTSTKMKTNTIYCMSLAG